MNDPFDPKLIAELRKMIPQKIAEDICSVQPINVTIETLVAACEWLEKSRIARGVHPITEEPLEGRTDH